MQIKSTERATLLMFIALAAVAFVVWVGLLWVFWLILRSAGISTDYWAMIEALSTAVAAAGLLSAGFVAYKELSEAASQRHIDIASRLFDELNSEQNIEARRWVFQNLKGDPKEGLAELSVEGRAAVKQVLNSLDHVAFLTQAGWIPDDIIMPWMHPMIAKAWARLEPYVLYERRRRSEPYYYQYVSELADRCRLWQAKHVPGWKVVWVEDAL
jgi:hypothetical protein